MKSHGWLKIITLSALFAIGLAFERCQADPLATWTQVFSSPVPNISFAYGNGEFVGVGGGARFISFNGSNWTTYANPPILNQAGIAYGGGVFMTFGTNTGHPLTVIYQSTNGVNFSPIYTNQNQLFAAAYGNNTWVFVGTSDIVSATLVSPTGTNVFSPYWFWSEYQPSFSPNCITFANGNFVLGAFWFNSYSILSCPDGLSWVFDGVVFTNIGYSQTSVEYAGITYGNGVYVTAFSVASAYGCVYTSANLVQWSPSLSFTYNNSPSLPILYGGNEFAFSDPTAQRLYSSQNGINWTTIKTNYFNSLAYGQGTFIGAMSGQIVQSATVTNQSGLTPSTLAISTYSGVTINGTPGGVYQVQSTASLASPWQTITNFMLPYSPFIWVDTTTPVAGQKYYRSVQLQ